MLKARTSARSDSSSTEPAPRRDLVEPFHDVRDLQGTDIGDGPTGDQGGPRGRIETSALAVGTGGEDDGPVDELPDVLLHRVSILGQERPLDPRDQPVEGDVRAVDPDLLAFGVEKVVSLLLIEVGDGFVRVEVAGFGEHAHGPTAGFVPGDRDGSVVQGFRLIDHLGDGDVRRGAHSLALRAHSAVDGEGPAFDLLALALVDTHRAFPAQRGHVEGVGVGRPEVRFCQTSEEGAQLRIDVRDRTHGGSRVRSDPFLIDEDGRRQSFEDIDFGSGHRGHEALDERGIGLVDHPLGLGGDGVEDQ